MKILDQSIEELSKLGPADLLKAYELIVSLRRRLEPMKHNKDEKPYIRVQKALQGCSGSLSEDILAAREDRV